LIALLPAQQKPETLNFIPFVQLVPLYNSMHVAERTQALEQGAQASA